MQCLRKLGIKVVYKMHRTAGRGSAWKALDPIVQDLQLFACFNSCLNKNN